MLDKETRKTVLWALRKVREETQRKRNLLENWHLKSPNSKTVAVRLEQERKQADRLEAAVVAVELEDMLNAWGIK